MIIFSSVCSYANYLIILSSVRLRTKELHKEKEAERRKAVVEKAAATSKGLSSIIQLDLDTLQNLESFRDSLCGFPPKSIKLKRSFAIQPWIDSDQNVGNLLMIEEERGEEMVKQKKCYVVVFYVDCYFILLCQLLLFFITLLFKYKRKL
ncbi:hypothetical protein PIB30_031342 [Stylosanthes scabra]|uniref:Uncharacterized protein n=1 Tax=Stylosanthes scabra TaxID=79078 RepID=A0ABU6UCX0_9FABA|nr:hypothetical protein [Stylosanthes scabra]